jgi:hypothetical protein
VTCSINKGKQNGNNKLCHPQESSPLSFDMFLPLKYSTINGFLAYQHWKNMFLTKVFK